MSPNLSRLLRPRSVAVVGGGAWCRQVVRQVQRMGFSGPIWRVHPDPAPVETVAAVPTLADLPGVPDATFLGVNRHRTVESVAALSRMGAGGAVCFASGFSEASGEDAGAADLQRALAAAADDMPILGPNCYGFINALDGALLWPDQHGCVPLERGVAILTQSSNIAINLTMQRRALPIAYMVTCGNMAQIRQAQIADALLDDPRVTAIGLHVEGFADVAEWVALARKAYAKDVPLVVLKVGASDQAQRATISHTASLAGSDAGAEALLSRLGLARVHDLPGFLETLKLLHCNGRLESNALSCVSCSGGEASLAADMAKPFDLSFPELTADQKTALGQVLGPMVALSNPLDYHTYVWGDASKMAAAWRPMAAAHIGLLLLVVDYPHTDAGDWVSATEAAISVRRETGRPVAVAATLPELMPEAAATALMAAGVTPLCGLREALVAAEAASHSGAPHPLPPILPIPEAPAWVMDEAAAKVLLSSHGLRTPRHVVLERIGLAAASDLEAPLALKALGLAHKSDAGAVRLGLSHADLAAAAEQIEASRYLVEEMVQGAVVELLVGMARDPAHGAVLTLGAGGVLTEIWQDSVSRLLPVTEDDVTDALGQLRLFPVLGGYRGRPAANLSAIVAAVMALQDCVIAQGDAISEVEINPLICTTDTAIAVDALISMSCASKPEET
ncbi:acetate--CoA ligase family protein [Roseobacter sinensis]|uniref:Acetate--CoA ligase family protein n=1 Tax=Roseobacter sinensis TaxID=2931391 RepID=A0ABT3B8D2_9RHOB|nr:acetate--CoA ligase family protein [Roseobacter sp. WL0113]MCV3269827.1 acetate--CoA ligase family protein [Roseobacter sp. WL0113]